MILTPELEKHLNDSPNLLQKGERWDYSHSKLALNRECGDAVVLFLKTESFENIHFKIIDCRFAHEGCVLSKMSANILTSMIRGMSIPTAKNFAFGIVQAIETGEYAGDSQVIKDLVNCSLNRRKCIVLPWLGLKGVQ